MSQGPRVGVAHRCNSGRRARFCQCERSLMLSRPTDPLLPHDRVAQLRAGTRLDRPLSLVNGAASISVRQ